MEAFFAHQVTVADAIMAFATWQWTKVMVALFAKEKSNRDR